MIIKKGFSLKTEVKENYENKYMEYFFKDYNESYFESNNNSILLFKKKKRIL